MIRQGHVGVYEMTALLSLSVTTKIFLSTPEQMVRLGYSAGWMIPAVAMVTMMVVFYLYFSLLKLYPGKSIVAIIEDVWGPWFGLPIIFFIGSVFLVIGAVTLRQFNETFTTVALPHTPISVLIIIQLAIASYASYLGLETITRTTFLMAPWLVVALIVIMLGIWQYGEIRYLLPIWGPGPKLLALNGLLRVSLFLEIFTLGVYAPYVRETKQLLPIGIMSTIFSGLFFVIVTALTISAASIPSATQIPYPLYFLARQIYLGRYIQRVEAIFIIIWFMASCIGLFLAFHSTIIAWAQALRLPFYHPLCFPTGVIMFAIAIAPPNFVVARDLDVAFLRRYGWVVVALLLSTYLLALIRKRGVRSSATTKG